MVLTTTLLIEQETTTLNTANLYNNSGNVVIVGKSLSVTTSGTSTLGTTSGEIHAGADVIAYSSSDRKLKGNIVKIGNALDKVKAINGVNFEWKEGFESVHSHKGTDIGVIAQEIEAILPEVVTTRENGYKAVKYEKLVAVLIEAVKELDAKIEKL